HVDPVDRLHDDVMALAVKGELEHLDHVGVDDAGGDLRLVDEHPHELRRVRQVRVDPLDHERPLEPFGPLAGGAKHLRHAAAADPLRQPIPHVLDCPSRAAARPKLLARSRPMRKGPGERSPPIVIVTENGRRPRAKAGAPARERRWSRGGWPYGPVKMVPLPPTAKKTRLLAVSEIALNAPLRPVERFPQVGPPELIASVKMARSLRSSVRVSARPSPSFSAWWVLPIGPGLVYNGSSMNLAGARVGVVVLLLSGLALEGRARAQAENVEEARAYVNKATAAYALNHYAVAAENFEKAFELKPDPALLYNAAQSYRLAGNKERALELYESYVRVYGGNKKDMRPDVEGHIKQLKEAIERDKAAATSPPTNTVPMGAGPETPGAGAQ